MKYLIHSLIIMLLPVLSFSQNEEIHNATVIGSFEFGSYEVTTIHDSTTGCERRTNPHSKNLFIKDETVQIKITDNLLVAEIIKQGLSERVFANKDCVNGNSNNTAILSNGDGKVSISCTGSCDCSLQGILTSPNSYVTCTCDECSMEIEYTRLAQIVEALRNIY